MAKKKTEEIVIDAFKAGKYPQGEFTTKELSEIASTYNPQNYEAPILIGHLSDPSYQGKSAIPAYGWIGKVKQVGDHLKLVASQFSEQLKEFIKDGFYKKVSAAFFQPDDPNNPTPGKWHLHHLAFLGGAPPAVKGLEQIAFAEFKSAGIEFAEVKAEIEIDGELVEEVKEMGSVDTMKDMAEYCGNFLKKSEDVLMSDADNDTKKERLYLAVFDLNSELHKCTDQHFIFESKMEGMQDKTELTEKKSWLVQMSEKVQSLLNKRKENEMDAVKEQEYQAQLAERDAKIKEFQEKERLATEAKAKADAEAKEAQLVTEVKTFCDQAVKEHKMTPAMRTTEEPIMLTLGKTNPDALKAFQQKYSAVVVPLGEMPINGNGGEQPIKSILDKAAEYVKANPKEFKGVDNPVARAVYLNSTGAIHL